MNVLHEDIHNCVTQQLDDPDHDPAPEIEHADPDGRHYSQSSMDALVVVPFFDMCVMMMDELKIQKTHGVRIGDTMDTLSPAQHRTKSLMIPSPCSATTRSLFPWYG